MALFSPTNHPLSFSSTTHPYKDFEIKNGQPRQTQSPNRTTNHRPRLDGGGNIFTGRHVVNIPRHAAFFEPSAPVWNQILPRLPTDSTICQAPISERILALPRVSRALLADKFWDGPAHLSENIVNDKRNEHCLVRPYLGRRRCRNLKPGTQNLRTTEIEKEGDENDVMVDERPGHLRLKTRGLISLRNYPLHIDQIEELALPAEEYAAAMGDALAFLLWGCEVDACDVEFVLARARPHASLAHDMTSIGNRKFSTSILGPHALWILDFDCCRPLPMTMEGVHLAAERFWRNDPYYPTPTSTSGTSGDASNNNLKNKTGNDAFLWKTFKRRFLELGARIMDWKLETKTAAWKSDGQVENAHEEQVRQQKLLPVEFIKRVEETVGVYSKGVPTSFPSS
ncbi:Zinc finger domain containing protein [Rhypophila decipiens]